MKRNFLYFLLVIGSLSLAAGHLSGCGSVSDNNNSDLNKLTDSRALTIINIFPYSISVEVSEVSNGDWNSQNRPERMARVYAPGETFSHVMDQNSWRKTHPATFTFYKLNPDNGIKEGTALGQWRMYDLNNLCYNRYVPQIETMRTGFQGKLQVITFDSYSSTYDLDSLNMVLVPEVDLTEWLTAVPDETYLSSLCYPGTHDSGTFHYGGVYEPWVITQSRNFTEMLDLGCRAFDIRLAPYTDNDLSINHDKYSTGLHFAGNFLSDCKNFLAAHPSEALLVELMKDYGDADTVKNVLDTILNETAWKDLIYVPTSFGAYPQLRDVRGKLVLIYDGGIFDARSKGYWLDYTSDISEQLTWWEGTPDLLWFVHSNYQATNAEMKIDHLTNYFNDLVKLNYPEKNLMPEVSLNAAEHNFATWMKTPKYFADNVNPWAFTEFLSLDKTKSLGIVLMDFYADGGNQYNYIGYLLIARNFFKHGISP